MAVLNPLRWWRALLALPNESRTKTLAVALLVALVSAAAVSVTSVALKPLQQASLDRQREARMLELIAAVPSLADLLRDADAGAIEMRLVDLDAGVFVAGDAETYDARLAASDPARSIEIPRDRDIAGLGRRANVLPVYVVMRGAEIALLVLPIQGSGYQSAIHAYLALEADLNTIAGISIYQQGETPGLGARIAEPAWQSLWQGRTIADETGAIRIGVVRGGAEGPYEVDIIAGATRSSNAVGNMVRFWLSDLGFGRFIAAQRGVEPAAVPDVVEPAIALPPAPGLPGVLWLADRHALNNGVACQDCHADATIVPHAALFPLLPASTATCLACHGPYAAVAATTARLFPNPHASHLGDLPCESCHRAHQPPVDYCAQCHNFGFVVP